MKKKKKMKKMRTTTVFATTEQYNCFRWPEIEEFSLISIALGHKENEEK